MFVSGRDPQDRSLNLSYAEFDDIRSRATAFGRVAAYTNTIATVADTRQPPARVLGAYVSAGAFELLGDRPIFGRTFRPDEDTPGGPAVVMLGGELWSSRYALRSRHRRPDHHRQRRALDRDRRDAARIHVPRQRRSVAADGQSAPGGAAVAGSGASPCSRDWPRGDRRAGTRGLSSLGSGWAREFPATNRDVRIRVVPINEQLNPSVAQRAWIAFITAGVLVLLVACANVANLLLMRAATRGREMAIRTSIGASRGRVVRQLLAESATLSALAGAFGVFVAWAGLRMLSGILPPEALPYWMAFTIDGRVLGALLAVCVVSIFVCGLPSALHVSKVDLRDTLNDSGTTTVARPARRWIAALLAAEFAVTFVLIAVAVMSASQQPGSASHRVPDRSGIAADHVADAA